jgi:nitroreductase
MDTLDAIRNRRSIRKYKSDPVSDQALEVILDAARLAPSWSNTQCTRFVVVRDSNLKAQLAETIQPVPNLGPNPAQNAVKNAPVVVVALAQKGLSGCFNGKTATEKEEWWFMFDVALAMQNLVLAAAALGLGTVYIGLLDTKKIATLLQIPNNFEVVTMTPLGYPEYQPNARPRKALSEIVYYEKFGQR